LDGQKIGTLTGDDLEEALWAMSAVDRFVWVPAAEGGCYWPVERDEYYSDAIVGFSLTTRYAPGILNRKGSRPEPFEFDPQDILDILENVHAWWPDAKALLWSVLLMRKRQNDIPKTALHYWKDRLWWASLCYLPYPKSASLGSVCGP